MNNPYEVLGVKTNASLEECKKAYRVLAVKHHPDSGGSEQKFQEIKEAWELIQSGKWVAPTPVRKKKPHLSHVSLFRYRVVNS